MEQKSKAVIYIYMYIKREKERERGRERERECMKDIYIYILCVCIDTASTHNFALSIRHVACAHACSLMKCVTMAKGVGSLPAFVGADVYNEIGRTSILFSM